MHERQHFFGRGTWYVSRRLVLLAYCPNMIYIIFSMMMMIMISRSVRTLVALFTAFLFLFLFCFITACSLVRYKVLGPGRRKKNERLRIKQESLRTIQTRGCESGVPIYLVEDR